MERQSPQSDQFYERRPDTTVVHDGDEVYLHEGSPHVVPYNKPRPVAEQPYTPEVESPEHDPVRIVTLYVLQLRQNEQQKSSRQTDYDLAG